MGIVIKGGRIFTATDDYCADLRIEEGRITAIGDGLAKPGDEIIDASGCYVLPGGIDTHTHFELDVGSTVTADDFSSGTKAAVAGGTTTILDYATQYNGESLKDVLAAHHQRAQGKCWCDYGIHMGITDWNEAVDAEMDDMISEGVTSFKLYMAYKGRLQVDDRVVYNVLRRCKEIGGLIGFHCENGDIINALIYDEKRKGHLAPMYHPVSRPASVEREAIVRLLNIAELAKAPVYVVHLSTGDGLMEILEAKKRGIQVYVETCPQYLLLDDSLYGKDDGSFEGAKYVMSPPLRKKPDQQVLWNGLATGEIQTVGTDHCSFNYKGQKELGREDFTKIPNGGPGVEHRLELLYTYGVCKGRLTMNQMVALSSTNAAKLFGMFPQKGTIAIGSDADIVIWNPEYKGTITAEKQVQNVDYTPYEGFEQLGRAEHVLLRGKVLVRNGNLEMEKPVGRYLHRKTCMER